MPATHKITHLVVSDGRILNAEDISGADKQFEFDAVFGPDATQLEVFNELAPLARSAVGGNQVCFFSYGQTGSGKTYTMLGK